MSTPAAGDKTTGAQSAGSVKSIGERVHGLVRGIDAKSVGLRVTEAPRSTRKSARSSKVVTASLKKAKKGEARATAGAVRLGGEEDDLSSFGSPLNLAARLERGSSLSHTQGDQLRHGRPFLPPARAPRDDDIQDEDDDVEALDGSEAAPSADALQASVKDVLDGPDVDSYDGGTGGEAFDSFESVTQAAVLDGVNDADRFAMGRAVIGLRDEDTPNEDRNGRDHDVVNQREQQPNVHTPRRSARLSARLQTPPSSDSAPYAHSIRTPNGRHFDHDSLDRWNDWSRNGRYCNGLPPYRSA